ncbi:MAG: transcriptional repressor NrdR [Gammaproteobacteria bacterium]|nr:transcriptional repressor NrdR [Gammaproteobacteria bacterium]MBL7000848.1 transcriptional repressor NrdR [Gammaproteobacteria bacterium]
MKCPFCGTPDTRVVDSRLANESNQVRRRRECVSCETRFTTYESPLLNMPMVIKNDGSRDTFDEQRVRNGMLRALEKRPVSAEQIEDAMSHIKTQLIALDAREVASRQIGEMVMRELQALDHVAYIRFASVYLSFEDIASFEELIRRLESEPTPELQRRQVPLIDDLDE